MGAEIITIETNTFSDQESRKVFAYLCKHIIKKTIPYVKKNILRIRPQEEIDWGHVMRLINRYGVDGVFSFSHDPNETQKSLTLKEINNLRLEKGMKALPEIVEVES